PAEVAVCALDAQVCRDTLTGGPLPFDSGDDQRAVVPGKLHIGTLHARHFDEDDDFICAFADVHRRTPRCALPWLLFEFEVHDYSRFFSKSFSSLINSWTSLKSRYTEA